MWHIHKCSGKKLTKIFIRVYEGKTSSTNVKNSKYSAVGKSLCTCGTQQQHTSTATSIPTTRSTYHSLSAQQLSERLVFRNNTDEYKLFHGATKKRIDLHNDFHCYFKIVFSSASQKRVKMNIHKILISHSVLYECGTWSLPLIEDHGQRMFQEECSVAHL
jgi:hypothetical protein